MVTDQTPLLWPESWKSQSALDLIHGTAINAVVTNDKTVARRVAGAGLSVIDPHNPPPGLTILEGNVAGIKLTGFGSSTAFSSGPTGEPWVNSNVWPVRLARARKPENPVWIRTQPPDNTEGAV